MTLSKQAVALALTLIAGMALTVTPASAHRFNVTLVIPASPEGREIRDGFMLATTEHDSHPDEESDGHLGGLDVYVTAIEVGAQMASLTGGQPDIVAVFGAGETSAGLNESGAVVLTPGQTPFAQAGTAGVAAFKAAYEAAYGVAPTPHAADGYNAARRIDVAVRPLDGADDRASLRQSFSMTAQDFAW